MATAWRNVQPRLGLRLALVLIAGFCVVTAWLAACWKLDALEAERVQSRIQHVEFTGGRATIDPSTGVVYNGSASGPQLHQFAHQFRNNRIASLTIVYPEPKHLTSVSDLNGLSSLELDGRNRHTMFDKTALAHLSRCSSLKSLRLRRIQLSKGAVLGLTDCGHLKSLVLKEIHADIRLLEDLEALNQLDDLSIEANSVPEDAVQRLKLALPNCTIVVEPVQARNF